MTIFSVQGSINKRCSDLAASSINKDRFTYTSLEDLKEVGIVVAAKSAGEISLNLRDPLVQKAAWLYLRPGLTQDFPQDNSLTGVFSDQEDEEDEELEERNNVGCFQFFNTNILLREIVSFFDKLGSFRLIN
ncbi:hypothetical protein TorRG33x02_056190 [Trema orientale]|uniref:Uncharacterized protein n=1 Tax=Trema orientale TaxID=63057 RepID=A0A2P5FLR5_TREOI|nr:hypothetical protein TorRG33x02_056190 [Trema orientale]